MAVVEATAPMTTAQLLALPNDGVERWLIRGQLREKRAAVAQLPGRTMTIRNRWHSREWIFAYRQQKLLELLGSAKGVGP